MDKDTRRVIETIYHGEDEGIRYSLTIPTTWANGPTLPALTVKNAAGTDVTATTTEGTTTVSGQTITLARITGTGFRTRNELSAGGIAAGVKYRIEVRFNSGDDELEAFGDLIGQE